ncbi:hypothetical protein LOD99_11294 [Oopsacas minuta]|uniref:Protein kinase domain-containing protein n=1 Tax=Oopsacas minuta TaxID=111878 RepID=A0AAV7K4S7_9METZ|nr:hypothetical protein LOD99_11294 [Oopsacas minuta]
MDIPLSPIQMSCSKLNINHRIDLSTVKHHQTLSPVSSSPTLSPEITNLECQVNSKLNTLNPLTSNSEFSTTIYKTAFRKVPKDDVYHYTRISKVHSTNTVRDTVKPDINEISLVSAIPGQYNDQNITLLSPLPKSYKGNSPPADYRKSFKSKTSRTKKYSPSRRKNSKNICSSSFETYEDISPDNSPITNRSNCDNCFELPQVPHIHHDNVYHHKVTSNQRHKENFLGDPMSITEFRIFEKHDNGSKRNPRISYSDFVKSSECISVLPTYPNYKVEDFRKNRKFPYPPPLPKEADSSPPPLPEHEGLVPFFVENSINNLETSNGSNKELFSYPLLDNIYSNSVNISDNKRSISRFGQLELNMSNDLNNHQFRRKSYSSLDAFEIIELVGEGTYGTVYKAAHIESGNIVALKKVRTDNEKEGFPITAVREIKILNLLRHENVIDLLGIISTNVCLESNIHKADVYLVFEYMDHDLMGLLDSGLAELDLTQIQFMIKQLLEAVSYCHRNNFLHRDLKCSNILISNSGKIKLADFGLARYYHAEDEQRMYTNKVITLWYRAPELLLGEERYGPPIDMWSCGCIFAELFNKKTLFMASREIELLDKICQLCGTPSPAVWPEVTKLSLFNSFKPKQYYRRRLKEEFEDKIPYDALELLDKLLLLDPNKRITAAQALKHQFFKSFKPESVIPLILPTGQDCHELWSKRRRKRSEQPPKNVFDEGEFGNDLPCVILDIPDIHGSIDKDI